MPERIIDLLFSFLRQNGGHFSARARAREFEALTDNEAETIEAIYADKFLKDGIAAGLAEQL